MMRPTAARRGLKLVGGGLITGFVLALAGPRAVVAGQVRFSGNLSGMPGETVTARLLIDVDEDVEAVDLRIAYDTALLDAADEGVRTGLTGRTLLVPHVEDPVGLIRIGFALIDPLTGGSGSLLEIDFRILPSAPVGQTVLDLQQASVNEDPSLLSPAPAPGEDPTDGFISIGSTVKTFRRGNVNGDAFLEISDAIGILQYLFLGQADNVVCVDAADIKDKGSIDISDGISVLNFLFQGGMPPAAPGPDVCGPDVNQEAPDLGCEVGCG